MERYGVKRVLNAMGAPTILGANTVSEPVRRAVDEALQLSVEIDELQAAACRVIARATGAEAGCVTSSCASGLAVSAAAAMTGSDLAKIAQLPHAADMPNEVVLALGHDINFGAPISQMIRLSGAKVVRAGTASHCDQFHLRGALSERTAALVYVDSGDVSPAGSFPLLRAFVKIAHERGLPLIVDTAAGDDVRGFVEAGADLTITSAHKKMGAPTSGMICGKLELVRACYLQNYGIGRAMKVGKEGVAGCMAAVEAWYGRDRDAEQSRWRRLADVLARSVPLRPGPVAAVAICPTPAGVSATALANRLREGPQPVWVKHADDQAGELHLDLSVMTHTDAEQIGAALARMLESPEEPAEDVAYHDLYWSERRLLAWPRWD